jgi:hypothetical protein
MDWEHANKQMNKYTRENESLEKFKQNKNEQWCARSRRVKKRQKAWNIEKTRWILNVA